MKAFDKKFGAAFASSLPQLPAVYRFFDASDQLIYVGKAKNLRRRLSQYRNAKRIKKHRKMKSIIAEAKRVEFSVFETHLDACLAETRLIQEKRPKWNVAGAFYFLYPQIGISRDGNTLGFCYTTVPGEFPGFEFHGSYRSREVTGSAFFALMKLFAYIGHRQPGKRLSTRYSYVYRFRQLAPEWFPILSSFFRGTSDELLEHLVLALVENAGARKKGRETQERLNEIRRFWRFEAKTLAKMIRQVNLLDYPVSQKDRDRLFILYREGFQNQAEKKSLTTIRQAAEK